MIRPFPIIAALLLLVASGVANGIWNDRWNVSHELDEITKRLPKVPMKIGDWVAEDDDPETAPTKDERKQRLKKRELADRLKKNGTLHELLSRRYVNQKTGEIVDVLMATGRPGTIATHNPLTCIGDGSGHPLLDLPDPATIPISDGSAVFARADFGSRNKDTDIMQNGLRVFWSWHDRDKGWVATEDPRTRFASYRALTKIYVTRATPPGDVQPTELKDEPLAHFINDCMPTIDAVLFNQTGK